MFIWPDFYNKKQKQKECFVFISSSLCWPAILLIRSRTKIRITRMFFPGLEIRNGSRLC